MPMPSASMQAAAKAALSPAAAEPKATPIAIPSGILCRVIANTREAALFGRRLSAKRCTRSAQGSRRQPAANPAHSGRYSGIRISRAYSAAGASREKNAEASITPAEKPNMQRSSRGRVLRIKSTGRAPKAVISQVNSVAISA